ncbi:DUF3223 domain-containing protein [Paraglaciecola marina]|uniref:DUF3223 domain-containing protein n=1 Tax=Paraglaciecola marina TaxID=2500157 RepID=UPI001414FFF1|nr:DUF3223 domain-containing protein [Paraglaciecola marina]
MKLLALQESILAKPISFGIFKFNTRKACEDEARNRVNSYSAGSIISTTDKEFFEALFTLHGEYDEKIGCGIKDIEVVLDFHKNKCLSIIRNDNSKVIISWRHCVKPYTKKMVVSYSFRRAVKTTVMEFKSMALSGGATCPVSNNELSFDNSHVSYTYVSFDDLLSNFLATKNLGYEDIELIDPDAADSDQRGVLQNTLLTNSWHEYHKNHAKLTLLSADANLRK